MEHLGELDYGERHDGRSLGVRLRSGRKPAACARSLKPCLHFLPPELQRRRRGLWRTGDRSRLRIPRHFAICWPHSLLQYSARTHARLLAAIRAQQQQRRRFVAPQSFLRDPAVPRPLQQEGGAMRTSRTWWIALILLSISAAALVAAESSWLSKVPPADRQRVNPYAGLPEAI